MRRAGVIPASMSALALGVGLLAGPAPAATPGSPEAEEQSPAAPLAKAPAVPSTPGPSGGSALALDQAIQAALARNPQVMAAGEAVTAAQQAAVAARAGFAPTVSASAVGGLGTSTTSATSTGASAPLSSPSATGSLSLGATLPVYDGGVNRATVESAEAALASAQAALHQVRQDTTLAVATAFFSVLAAERLTSVQEALLAQAESQLALSQAQVRVGVAPQSDVIQVQAQVAQAQVNLLGARSQIATAKASLQGAIGVDAAAPVEVQEPAAPSLAVTVTADAAMAAAEANRPEVAKAEAAVQLDQAALDLARVNAGPQVSVAVGTAYTPVSTSPLLANSMSYGLTATISLPVFDSGKGQAGIASAQATLRSAQAQREAIRVSVRQDAYQAYLASVQDAATITATQAAQAAADAALRVAQGRYRAGVGTIVEVITAQAQAAQADVNGVNALYTYESALATFRHAEGVPVVASAQGGAQ